MVSSSLILILCVFLFQVYGFPVRRSASIHLQSSTDFCFFLPPHPGDDVGATEDQGIPFCSNTTTNAFPQGLIVSSHFESQDAYVQVTGRLNPDAYQLSHTDGGGQYDNKDISDVTCNGYDYFVNMLEPDNGQYCIRCCESQSDCNLGESTKGCEAIVPGDYS
ncbi:uncharacterized protein BX664DRAFT_337164 [Halteromyces radiatus]|uniref:uncharacterized protein n=1 Tax=Halteromyces radiatus TaxID=101107 RepID=UPI00221E3FB6|nr:uncharacterized protein BX664DRAFT_337164 [Halteromyces radiatus]KAI8084513.1 hypothetical protein BX664DRAFT_337164 [Halteromyces radiatus]